MKTSGVVFIKNTISGAYCLFESLATMLPLCDEVIVLDLGSDDGTLEHLQYIEIENPKVSLVYGQFNENPDANDFAKWANLLIEAASYERVLFWQADEIWHQDLFLRTKEALDAGRDDLTFWRIQYRENFQIVKWFPHPVHRVGRKERFNFVGDGMNTDRYFEPPMLSAYGMEYFTQWSDIGPEDIKPYVNDMIMDVSQVGAFRDNIVTRRAHHAPFWNESVNVEGQDPQTWLNEQKQNQNWILRTTPYNIPAIMRYHLGRTRYEVRPQLIHAIGQNNTLAFLGLQGDKIAKF